MKQKIIVINGVRYYRAAETNDFIFFVNYGEADDCLMYRQNGELVSNNYFASVGLDDAIRNNELTFTTRRMKQAIAYMRKHTPEFFEA